LNKSEEAAAGLEQSSLILELNGQLLSWSKANSSNPKSYQLEKKNLDSPCNTPTIPSPRSLPSSSSKYSKGKAVAALAV
jgi:hypothetical protein